MTVREKMIEVIRESEMACDDAVRLADRLIAAGFGQVKRGATFCPECGLTWLEGRECDCENEFHALENKQ